METLNEKQIAAALGIDPAVEVFGFQHVTVALHDHYAVDTLVIAHPTIPGERHQIPCRLTDLETREVWTRIPDEPGIYLPDKPSKIWEAYWEMMEHTALVSFGILPALADALPDYDQESKNVIRIQAAGGGVLLANLEEDGRLTNIREPIPLPTFKVNRDGNLICDISHIHESHHEKIKAAMDGFLPHGHIILTQK